MAAGFIRLPPDSTGKYVDTSELTVSANTVERENHCLGDPTTAAAIAAVENGQPGSTDYGLVVRMPLGWASAPLRIDPTGTTSQPVSGTVSITDPAETTTGSNVPSTAIYIAGVNNTGKLTGLNTDSSGNLLVNLNANSFGTITVTGSVSVSSGTLSVTQSTTPWVTQDKSDVTAGTTSAPTTVLVVAGKTADGTPAYDPLPLAAGGGSVVVSGSVTASGSVSISSGSVTFTNTSIAVTQSTSPWVVSQSAGPWTVIGNTTVSGLNGTNTQTIAVDNTGALLDSRFGPQFELLTDIKQEIRSMKAAVIAAAGRDAAFMDWSQFKADDFTDELVARM